MKAVWLDDDGKGHDCRIESHADNLYLIRLERDWTRVGMVEIDELVIF